MTGIPFSFPQLGNSQVIPLGTQAQHPDLGQAFLQAFLQSAAQGQQQQEFRAAHEQAAKQHADTLAMEQQRIDLAKAAAQRTAEHDAAAIAQQAREGETLRQWAMAGAPLDKLPASLGGPPAALMPAPSAGAAAVPGAPGGAGNMVQTTGRDETTRLSPSDEAKFQAWAAANKIADVNSPEAHYDYRGFWKAGGPGPAADGHFPDTFKQHGHPTFSVESQYSTSPTDGGQWVGGKFVPSATPAGPATPATGRAGALTALPTPNNPLAMLGPLLQNMRAEDIPGAVQKLIPMLGLQAQFQEQSDKYTRINAALTNIKDPAKKAGAVALLGLAEGGVHLTQEQVSKVLPQLAVVDPSTLNSAVEFWVKSTQPWGRIRSVFGLPASQVPDGITYTGPAGKEAKLSTGQQEALMQLPILQQSNAVMTRLEAGGTELGTLGAWLKAHPAGSISDLLNKGQTEQQREYMTAQQQFADVSAYAFSGKTATNTERMRILSDFAAQGSDPQAVKEQKARARQAFILSLQDRLTGQLSPVQAADRLLKTPGLLSPEQRQTIMQLRKQGATYEQAVRTGRGLPVTITDTPSTPDVLMSDSAKVQSIIEQLPDSALGGRPQPQRGAPRNPGAFGTLLDFSRALTPSVTPPRPAP